MLGTDRATVVGHIIGTLAYMAPEQIRGEDVTASADLYSTGIVLYELLTGRTPFNGKTDWELMQQHLSSEVPSLQPLAADVPKWMDDVIRRAVSKTPAERFESAAAFRAELDQRAASEPRTSMDETRLRRRPNGRLRCRRQSKLEDCIRPAPQRRRTPVPLVCWPDPHRGGGSAGDMPWPAPR